MAKVKRYLVITIVIIFVIFSCFNTFENLENMLRDRIYEKQKPVDTRIVMIGIDEESLQELGQWPWPRTYHSEVLKKLQAGGAGSVGIDIIFSENARSKEEDFALNEAIKEAGNVVLPVYGLFPSWSKAGGIEALKLDKPQEAYTDAVYGHINFLPDKDGVVRKGLLFFTYNGERIDSFSWQIYKTYLESLGVEEDIHIPLDEWNRFNLDFSGKPGDMEYISYHRVYKGEIPVEYFKDKIVLIGTYAEGLNDFYLTPLDTQTPMYGVEVHANIIQALLWQRFKEDISDLNKVLIMVFMGLVGATIFRQGRPGRSAVFFFLLVLCYVQGAIYIYQQGYILPLIYPVLLLVLLYVVYLGYHYVNELTEKKRITNIFGRYVSTQVVDEILDKGEEALKLGGDRREISVVFVDIRNFTTLAERMKSEEVVGILNEYMELCARTILKYGGTLDKYIGDAVMAVFNAPLYQQDHTFYAVKTAWEIKKGAEEIRKRVEEKYGTGLQLGIGVHTGEAVVGNIGASFRMEYTAIGDTVNTASRLEGLAQEEQILISEAVYEKIKDRVNTTAIGEKELKGKRDKLSIFLVDGIKGGEGYEA